MRTFKRLIAMTLILFFLLSMLTVGVLAADTVPSGYTAISTPEQLDNIRNNLSGKYILTADIDLTEALAKGGSLYDAKGWIAIGYLSSGNTSPFTGVLDGNGHTISGITAKGGTGIAHFIHTNQGTITNLTISGTFSSGGVFCLKNEGLIQNCHNKATITTSVYTSSETNYGGLVNTNSASGLVEYCSNQADITGDVYSNGGMNDKSLRIGGIVGGNAGTVRKCYNSGNLTCVGHKATSAYVAGIVGYGDSKSVIENCYNTGKIYANMTESGYDSAYNVAAAGILATVYYQNSTTIKYCYNAGSISMSSGYHNDYLGAIAGFHAKSTFTNCYYLSGSCGQATYSGENSSIVKLTENQMRTQSAFTGFDFTGVWSMGSGTYRYPVLKARCTHAVDKVNATPATCTTDGNIAYWYCNICSKYFSSSSKSKEITRAETVISAGHSWTEAEELEDRLVPGSGSDCQSAKEYYYGCANCDAVSETEKFSSDVMGSHRMSSEWTFADNAHYHGCTVSGCHYTEDNAPCSGGTATCMNSAVCTVCENAYGTTNPSNHTGNTSRENVRGASCTVNGYTGDTVCECGKTLEAGTVIPAFGHSWDKGTVTKEPSEDETGIRVYVCDTCGDTREEEIPKLEHTHNYNAVVTDPTCTKDGYTTYTCKCGDSYVAEETPALGHKEVTDKGYAATCTETGLTDGVHCDRCNTVLTKQEEIPALGHKEVTDKGYASTCTETGLTDGIHCDRCTEVLTAQEEILALGHKEVTDKGYAATCTETGLTDGVHCDRCNTVLTKQEEIPALGHKEVTDKGYAATCTETGLTDGVHCDRCTEVLTAQEEIPALGHSWDEGVVTKEPTEAETGIRIHTCKVCGETKEEIIPALDHEHKYTATVTAPTCTEAGYITYTCSCGDSYSEAGKPAAGHTEIIDYGTDATCTESGLTDGSHCNKCGEILTAQEEIPALGHSEVIDASVHATCTETGLTEGKHCDRCDEILVAQKVVPALGHSWDEGIVTKEPTEKETGIKTFTCTVCKQTRTEEIPCVDPVVPEIFRLYGDSRVTTAIAVANKMKEVLGRESFDVILIANGNNFADALTGSYLASVKEAPILLYRSSGAALNEAYIQENLSDDGIVYILGGTEAVPADVEERLTAAGFKVQRLCGDSRYSTNLEILNIAGVSDQEILICTGIDYADSLAASATGLPIVMVNNITGKLTKEQIAFFEAHTDNKFTIVGGNAAVSDELQAKIEAIVGPVERVFGDSRETTSVAIAERYFGTPECVLIAYSRNFPDGLCGGPLANAMGAPLLLVNSRKEAPAAEYVSENGIAKGIVLGGTLAISEDVVRVVFDIS